MKIMMKELGEIITGNTPSKKIDDFWDSDDICFVKPDIISDNGVNEICESIEYISEAARKKARVVSENAIFVICIGSIGKIGIASAGEYAFNQQINAVVPNDKVEPKYLAYNLLYNKPRLIAMANAPVVPIINKSQFGEFTVNINTDKSKQLNIVEVLDKLTHIIEQRNHELSALDVLIKARFVELFGDPTINPKGWDKIPWKDMFDTQTGKLDSNAAVADGEYPFFTCAKEWLRIDNYAYDCEALLLAGNNAAGVYDVKHYKGKFNAYQRTYILQLKNQNCEYPLFKYQLEERLVYLQSQSKGTNTRYLTMEILNSLSFINPPVKLQKQFTEFVEQVDKSKVAVQKALDETQLLFDSLMQQYFG